MIKDMKLSIKRALRALALAGELTLLIAATANGAIISPVVLTGWNADVVFENAKTPTATSFDHPDPRPADYPLYAWFESGLEGHSDGLPANRRIVSAADTNVVFELQPYTTNNVLLLSAAKPSGTLALTAPMACRSLVILAAAGGGDAAVTLQLHFSDDTDSDPIACQAPDWFTGAESKVARSPAIKGLGRSNGKEGFDYEEHGDDAFGLYQMKIDLTALQLEKKTIQSINFKKGNGGVTAGIFAVSGERAKAPDSSVK